MGISLSGLTESSTGNLTLSAGSGNDVLIGNGSTQIFIDGGTDTLGIGGTAVSGSRLNIETGAVALDFITSTGTAINVIADTVNDTSGAATIAIVPTVQIGVMTYTATNSMTYTNTASLYIAGIPVASTNVTFTNASSDHYALWVDDGAVRFDDRTFWIGGVAYEFPADNGNANEFLLTDGSGNLSWSSVASASASTTVTVTDNEAENESNLITFVAGAASTTGNYGLEMDGDFTYSPNTGTVAATNLSLTDNGKVQLGTGNDATLYYDGTDTFMNLRAAGTGDLMIALAGSYPSPDPNAVHIWRGSAGSIAARTEAALIVENSHDVELQLLTPNNRSSGISFGSPDNNIAGMIQWQEANARFSFHVEMAERLRFTASSFDFLQATTISAAGNLTLSANTGSDVLIGDNETLLYVDGGVPGVGFGAAPTSQFRHYFSGSWTTGNSTPSGFRHDSAITTTHASANTYLASFDASVTTAASSSATTIAQVRIDEPNITLGSSASLTNSASLYIQSVASEATNDYALWVNTGTSRFDGAVGIGVVDPTASHGDGDDLVIGGAGANRGITILTDSANDGVIYFADATSGSGRYEGSIEYDQNDRILSFRSGTSKRMYIDGATGNVGIGDKAPQQELDVFSASAPTIRITNTTNTSSYANGYINGAIEFYSEDATNYGSSAEVISAIKSIADDNGTHAPAGSLGFYTAQAAGQMSEKMRLHRTGSLKLGDVSTAPAYKLDVTGNGVFLIADSGTNTQPIALTLAHSTSNTPADGLGVSLNFQVEKSNGGMEGAAQIVAKLADVTAEDEDGQLEFHINKDGGTAIPLYLMSSGNSGFGASNVGSQLVKIEKSVSSTTTTATGEFFSFKNSNTTDNTYAAIDWYNSAGYLTARIGGQFTDTSDRDTDLFFMTRADGGNLTEHMRIKSDGNVGIGTTGLHKLHVYGGASGQTASSPSNLVIEHSTSQYMTMLAPQNSVNIFAFGHAGDSGRSGQIVYGGSTHGTYPNKMVFRTAGDNDRMAITATGVGINTLAPEDNLEVADAAGGHIVIRREDTAVLANDIIGTITFQSKDAAVSGGTHAQIRVTAVEDATSNDAPSAMIFSTIKNATSGLVNNNLVLSGEKVGIGDTPDTILHVTQSGGQVLMDSGGDDHIYLYAGDNSSNSPAIGWDSGSLRLYAGGNRVTISDAGETRTSVAFIKDENLTFLSNQSYSTLSVNPSNTFTVNNGVTVARFGSAEFVAAALTNNGTVNNAYVVRISGEPQNASTNVGLWVDGGRVHINQGIANSSSGGAGNEQLLIKNTTNSGVANIWFATTESSATHHRAGIVARKDSAANYGQLEFWTRNSTGGYLAHQLINAEGRMGFATGATSVAVGGGYGYYFAHHTPASINAYETGVGVTVGAFRTGSAWGDGSSTTASLTGITSDVYATSSNNQAWNGNNTTNAPAMTAFRAAPRTVGGSGVINRTAGFYIEQLDESGAEFYDIYGFYCNEITRGSNANYGFAQRGSSMKNFFEGNTTIGPSISGATAGGNIDSPLHVETNNPGEMSYRLLALRNDSNETGGANLAGTGVGIAFDVGDGNTGPSQPGHVYGYITTDTFAESSLYMAIRAGNATPTTANGHLVIKGDGNVGIGTAAPTDGKLHILNQIIGTDGLRVTTGTAMGTNTQDWDSVNIAHVPVFNGETSAHTYQALNVENRPNTSSGYDSTGAMGIRGIRYKLDWTGTNGGNITGASGLHLDAPANSGGGTLSTYWAIYAAASTIATTNYGIVLEGSEIKNHLGGMTTLDTTSASVGGELKQEYAVANNTGGFGVIRKVIRKTGIAHGTVTNVATIATTNESGNLDAGTYVCKIKAMVAHGGNNNAAGGGPAVRYWEGVFSQAIDYTGADTTSTITEISNGTQAAVNDGQRNITDVEVTVTDTSVYVKKIAFEVDLSGSNVENAEVVVLVEVIWDKFRTAPVLLAS